MSTLKTIAIRHLNGSSDNISLDVNGRVGIGNNSPVGKFTVQTPGADGFVLDRDTNDTGNSGRMFFLADGTNFAMCATANTLSFFSGSIPANSTGTIRMSIDSSGRVTKPYQPMFYAQHNNTGQASNRYGYFTGEYVNQGSHATHGTFGGSYNYTRFTCPIAGKYMVWVGNIGNPSGTTQRTYVYKNGSQASPELRTAQTGNHGTSASMTTIINAAANDWIACLSLADDSSSGFYSGVYSHMGVMLIA